VKKFKNGDNVKEKGRKRKESRKTQVKRVKYIQNEQKIMEKGVCEL
jgi:hypothetical protein